MHLDEADIRAVLRWDELMTAMEQALAAFPTGRVLQPMRNMLTIEEEKRYLGIMPAVTEDNMGLKAPRILPTQRRHYDPHTYGHDPVVHARHG